MQNQHVFMGDLTRREFREALAEGKFQTAIIPTGSIEQHLEHLAMEHDIRMATMSLNRRPASSIRRRS